MRITKYEHACLVVEEAGATLVIDPGSFTRQLDGVSGVDSSVVGVVITHEHADHWTPEQLRAILAVSPDAVVFSTEATRAGAAEAGIEVDVVGPGDSRTVEPFTLRFFGGRHAIIHSSIPQIDNVGVLVNDALYYPGDSFAVPEGVPVRVLASPCSGPWMKVAETMDHVLAIAPDHVFPTHERINSDAGMALAHARLGWAAAQHGGEYHPLSAGDSLEI